MDRSLTTSIAHIVFYEIFVRATPNIQPNPSSKFQARPIYVLQIDILTGSLKTGEFAISNTMG